LGSYIFGHALETEHTHTRAYTEMYYIRHAPFRKNRLFDNLNNFIYLLLALLDLCCYMDFFSSSASKGYSLIAVCGLLIAVAFLAVEHRL